MGGKKTRSVVFLEIADIAFCSRSNYTSSLEICVMNEESWHENEMAMYRMIPEKKGRANSFSSEC